MFKEYWNGYTALGVVVGVSLAFNIVGFLSVGFDWVGLGKAFPNTYNYAQQQCRRQEPGYSAQVPPILKGEQTLSARPEATSGDGTESKEPDWCDLAAQQSMADSTSGMEQAAWVALALSIVGVVLIWRTLYYTRKTLEEAKSTTATALASVEQTKAANDAARDALQTTRELTTHQLRAYVTPDFTALKFDPAISARLDGAVTIKITGVLKNFGKTPATNVKVRTKVETVLVNKSDPLKIIGIDIEDSIEIGVGYIAPGDKSTVHVNQTLTFAHDELMEGTRQIVFVGRVDYETIGSAGMTMFGHVLINFPAAFATLVSTGKMGNVDLVGANNWHEMR